MNKRAIGIWAAFILLFGISSVANASLIFEIKTNINGAYQEVEIRGSGVLDPASSFSFEDLHFIGATQGVDDYVYGPFGNFNINGVYYSDAFSNGSDFVIQMYAAVTTPASVYESLSFEFDLPRFQAHGTTGDIYSEDGASEVLGQYRIVSEFGAVPEPGSLALFGLGLAGIGWRRKVKAKR